MLATTSDLDGRRLHYRDLYQPDASPHDECPLWLVWGNCQAEALRSVLNAVPDRPYRTARIPPVHEFDCGDLRFLDVLLEQTAVLFTQPVRAQYRGLPLGVADLLDRLSPRTTVVRWPVIRYAGLYPFQAIVRDPRDRSITPPGVPYHDLRTVAAVRAGRTADEPWDVDVTDTQIQAVAAASLDELARREARDTDVAISDALTAYGAEAAHTINHPGNAVLYELARRLLDSCGVSTTAPPIADTLLDSAWAPLEARVIKALDITATPRSRWRLNGVELEPQDVHATQLAWYSEHPAFIDLAVRRHGKTMTTLGLLGKR